ncbi:hypothetical protein DL96DRAFT_1620779 [Flagelloscypha sp. PMI_526]|nr:hypothetical protein DL96DRAFT_1620779 [Flagelloscypha sp. PMI_526]
MSRFVKKALKSLKKPNASTTTVSSLPPEVPVDAAIESTQTKSANPITLAIVGCGQRGKVFANYIDSHSEFSKLVAIAEPRENTRKAFAKKHQIPSNATFESVQQLLDASDTLVGEGHERIADAVVICVQDRMHAELTIEFARRGFHILCEKPLGVDIEECVRVSQEVEKADVVFALGHNFPYSPYAASLTKLIHSQQLGRLLNIQHLEPIGYYHFAHSYVRGNWKAEGSSAPIVLTNFGSLGHFRKERKPEGIEDVHVESVCEYSAKKIYLLPVQGGNSGWPGNLIVDGEPTVENMTKALEETDYGRCVYESSNDNSNLPPTNPTVNFTIVGHTSSICMRQTRLHFEHGEVIGDMTTYRLTDFRDMGRGTRHVVPPSPRGGHGAIWVRERNDSDEWLDSWNDASRSGGSKDSEVEECVPGEKDHGPLGYGATVKDQLNVFLTGFAD